jgi:hypothetical protein
MWVQTNERYLDRCGCGDEIHLDAKLKALSALAALYDGELLAIDEVDDADDAAAH